MFGPRKKEERQDGPCIVNPSYDEGSFPDDHIYAEIGGPTPRIYANVNQPVQGQKRELSIENLCYDNPRFRSFSEV